MNTTLILTVIFAAILLVVGFETLYQIYRLTVIDATVRGLKHPKLFVSRHRTDLPRGRCNRIHPQHRQIYLIPWSKTFNSTMNDPSRLLPEEELHCQNTLLPLQAPVLKSLLPKGFHCSVSHG